MTATFSAMVVSTVQYRTCPGGRLGTFVNIHVLFVKMAGHGATFSGSQSILPLGGLSSVQYTARWDRGERKQRCGRGTLVPPVMASRDTLSKVSTLKKGMASVRDRIGRRRQQVRRFARRARRGEERSAWFARVDGEMVAYPCSARPQSQTAPAETAEAEPPSTSPPGPEKAAQQEPGSTPSPVVTSIVSGEKVKQSRPPPSKRRKISHPTPPGALT